MFFGWRGGVHTYFNELSTRVQYEFGQSTSCEFSFLTQQQILLNLIT